MKKKKFVVLSWQNRHFYSDIDFEFRKMKKSDLFLLFFECIKSRVLPKFCVNVDKYYFFSIFWMFFSFLAKRRQNMIKKKYNLCIFSKKLTFLVRHQFWLSKNGKKCLFAPFILKYEKSFFPKFCVKVDWYHFFHFFLKVFSFLVKWC